MSASPVARQAVSQAIPVNSRRVVVNHESELPNDLSSTPGGSIFSTTPGGTRVYYERSALVALRNSPLARTPPANLPHIKGVTVPDTRPKNSIAEEDDKSVQSIEEAERRNYGRSPAAKESAALANGTDLSVSPPKDSCKDDDDQFQMEL